MKNLFNIEEIEKNFYSYLSTNDFWISRKYGNIKDDVTKYVADSGGGSIIQRCGQGSMVNPFDWTHLFRHFVVANLINKSNLSILDVGCGEAVLRRILRRGSRIAKFNYVGMDIRKRMLLNAAEDTGKHPATFFVTDLRKPWKFLKNNKFDFVIAMEIIEHMNEINGFNLLKKCKMKLKKGGTLVLSTPQYGFKDLSHGYKSKLKYNKGKEYYAHHVREYTREELKKLFGRFDLEIVGEYGYGTQIKIFEKYIKGGTANKGSFRHVYKALTDGIVPKTMAIPLLSYANPQFATFLLYVLKKG